MSSLPALPLFFNPNYESCWKREAVTDNKVQWNGRSARWKTRKASHADPKLDIDVLCGLISWFPACKLGTGGCCLQLHSLTSVCLTNPAHMTLRQTTKQHKSKRKLEMKQSEVIGSWHYPEDVCQHYNLAKRPLYYRTKEIFCYDMIMIWGGELLKKHLNSFHTVLLKNSETRAGMTAA